MTKIERLVNDLRRRVEQLEAMVLLLEARIPPVDAVGTRRIVLKEFPGKGLNE